MSQGPWRAAGGGRVTSASPRTDPAPGHCQSRGTRGGRAERGERSHYTSRAAHAINRSGCKLLPKHLLRIPAGVGTEPGCPRISFPQRDPPGLPQGPTPSKAAPGLVPAAAPPPSRVLGAVFGLCSVPMGLEGAQLEDGTHWPRPVAHTGTRVHPDPLCAGDVGGGHRKHTNITRDKIFSLLFFLFLKHSI